MHSTRAVAHPAWHGHAHPRSDLRQSRGPDRPRLAALRLVHVQVGRWQRQQWCCATWHRLVQQHVVHTDHRPAGPLAARVLRNPVHWTEGPMLLQHCCLCIVLSGRATAGPRVRQSQTTACPHTGCAATMLCPRQMRPHGHALLRRIAPSSASVQCGHAPRWCRTTSCGLSYDRTSVLSVLCNRQSRAATARCTLCTDRQPPAVRVHLVQGRAMHKHMC